MTEHSLANRNGHRHEDTDANVRGVVFTGVGLAVAIGVALLIVLWTLGGFQRFLPEAPPQPFAGTSQAPPEPRLQYNPEADLEQLRSRENAILETYGWTDQAKGVARIPLNRAIDLMAEGNHFPARGNAPVTTSPPSGAPSGGPNTGPPVAKTPRPNPPPPQGVEH